MMFNRVLLIALLTFLSLGSPVQSQVTLDWAACYNGPANDYDAAQAICFDDSGYVYVTGSSRGGALGTSDFATIKYDPFGNEVWVRRYFYKLEISDVESTQMHFSKTKRAVILK